MSSRIRTAVLVARCDNFREDIEQPCTGTLRFTWGMSQAACDTCGGWCGVAVADWTEVETVTAPELSETEAAIVARFEAADAAPESYVRQHRSEHDCWCGPVQVGTLGVWTHNMGDES